ncbi:hypothetical protein EVAR_97208_1 [Eumeta japonica]|uniref:Uncharacterized protein n=1 Tax=Eumeta variegata TaxID=151549 RepID=A0A4C1WFJ4_EUMVA|nr:hypothetical protein EVAR_97208_1 [Eumeta japonica]
MVDERAQQCKIKVKCAPYLRIDCSVPPHRCEFYSHLSDFLLVRFHSSRCQIGYRSAVRVTNCYLFSRLKFRAPPIRRHERYAIYEPYIHKGTAMGAIAK